MKKTTILLATICLLLLLTSNQLSAQTIDSLYHVETTDGNEYIGIIMEQNSQSVKIKTDKLGILTILRIDIKSITPVEKEAIKEGRYWFHNPQSTRYFWQPNGYGLKKGEGYYQNVWIFFNQVSVGVTNNFSLGVGIFPAFLIAGSPTPVWITPKVSIPIKKDKVNVGLGIMAGTVLGADEVDEYGEETNSNFGVAYGSATFGSRDKNITFGMGYGYAGGGWAQSPTVTMSFMIRTGDRTYLISENYLLSTNRESAGLIMLGARRLVKKVALDFGGIMPIAPESGSTIVLPWLGVSVPFQLKKKV